MQKNIQHKNTIPPYFIVWRLLSEGYGEVDISVPVISYCIGENGLNEAGIPRLLSFEGFHCGVNVQWYRLQQIV